jgi:hypothetical protein
MATLIRPKATELAPYMVRYTDLAPDGDIVDLLERQRVTTLARLDGIEPERARFRYAPGKWSVIEVIGHCIDAERVFAYRALRFGRRDRTPLPPFDENLWVPEAAFDTRSMRSVAEEFDAVRQATIQLFRGLPEGTGLEQGEANGYTASVQALAYMIFGHWEHHRAMLESRYLQPSV